MGVFNLLNNALGTENIAPTRQEPPGFRGDKSIAEVHVLAVNDAIAKRKSNFFGGRLPPDFADVSDELGKSVRASGECLYFRNVDPLGENALSEGVGCEAVQRNQD